MDQFSLNLIMIIGFVLGSGLIVLEAFIPGFGVAGICGVVLEIAALYCCWQLFGVGTALLAFVAVLVLIGVALLISYRSAMNGRLSKSPLVLKDTEEAAGPSAQADWTGKTGTAVTALRPAGEVEIAGVRMNASSAGEFVAKGTEVTVTGTEGGRLVVRAKA